MNGYRFFYQIKSIWNVRLKDFPISHILKKIGSFILGGRSTNLLSWKLRVVEMQEIFILLMFIFMIQIFWTITLYGDVYEVDFRMWSILMFWKSQSTCWMLVCQRGYLKLCRTLSESGASNKIVIATKPLKVNRSRNFIERANLRILWRTERLWKDIPRLLSILLF